MCNILLRDPLQNIWQLASDDNGLLNTTLTSFQFPFGQPALQDVNGVPWQLSADAFGRIVVTQGPAQIIAQPFFALTSPSNKTFKLTIGTDGRLNTNFSATPLNEAIPIPFDIAMSRWPISTGVICPRCANASINVGADFSCWCCVCQAFVDPNDTTIIVVLDE